MLREYGTAIFAPSHSDGLMSLAHAQMREGWVVVEMRYQLNWNPGNIHAYTMELQAYTVRWSTNYMPPSVIDAPFLWSVRCRYFAQWSLSRNYLRHLSMLECQGILWHGQGSWEQKGCHGRFGRHSLSTDFFLLQLKDVENCLTLWRIDL